MFTTSNPGRLFAVLVQVGGGRGLAIATEALVRSTAQRSGPSSRATGTGWMSSWLVMPGRTMTPFRSPLTHTVRVAASRSSSRPCAAQT